MFRKVEAGNLGLAGERKKQLVHKINQKTTKHHSFERIMDEAKSKPRDWPTCGTPRASISLDYANSAHSGSFSFGPCLTSCRGVALKPHALVHGRQIEPPI